MFGRNTKEKKKNETWKMQKYKGDKKLQIWDLTIFIGQKVAKLNLKFSLTMS